ncbi:MAG: energy transducer TonB [bacterium]
MEITFEKTRSDLARERFGFSFFLAVAIHLMVIFGIGFSILQHKNQQRSLDVTLAVTKTTEEVTDADFIAQANQLASGTENEVKELTTDNEAQARDENVAQQAARQTDFLPPAEQLLTTTGEANLDAAIAPEEQPALESQQPGEAPDSRSEALAGLKAKLDKMRQEYSKMPKILRMNSVSTKSDEEAAYLLYWVEHAERVGNENYPVEAELKQIYGELQLAVTVLPSGALGPVEIQKSSGHRILDLAAIRTVKLAAPFAPLPETVTQDYDQLEIIRTWRYLPGDRLETHRSKQ